MATTYQNPSGFKDLLAPASEPDELAFNPNRVQTYGSSTRAMTPDEISRQSDYSQGAQIKSALGEIMSGQGPTSPAAVSQANRTDISTDATRREAQIQGVMKLNAVNGVPESREAAIARILRAEGGVPAGLPPGTAYNPSDNSIRDIRSGAYFTGYSSAPGFNAAPGLRFSMTQPTLNYPPGGAANGTIPGYALGNGGTPGAGGANNPNDPNNPDVANYNAPDTGDLDARIKALAQFRTPEDIDKDLAIQEQQIRDEADAQLREANRQAEDQSAQDFSELAGVGTGINPLSSAARSVGERNAATAAKFRNNIIAQRDAKLAAARLSASGQKTDTQMKQLQALEDERNNLYTRAQTEFENRRKSISDTVESLNRAAQQAKENRLSTNSERDDARANIKFMFDSLGSRAFEGASDEDISALEKAAGLPAGSIKKGTQTVKEQELAAKKKGETPDFKFISGGKYQQSGYFDPTTGKFVSFGGGGGGGGTRGGGGGGGVTANSLPNDAIRAYIEATGDYDLSKANLSAIQKVWDTRKTTLEPLAKGLYGPPTPTSENPFLTLKKSQLQLEQQYRGKPTTDEGDLY